MPLSVLKPNRKGRSFRRFPLRERESLASSESTEALVFPSSVNPTECPPYDPFAACLHVRLEESFSKIVPSLDESVAKVEMLLERIRITLVTFGLEETVFEGLKTMQTEWVILAKRADLIVLESRRLAASVAYTIRDFCGDLANFLLQPNISKQEKEHELLAFKMRLQAEECCLKSDSLNYSIQEMCGDLDAHVQTWNNVQRQKDLADLFNDVDKLREELKRATTEVYFLLAKAIFNATCVGAIIAIGVLTGDPSTFISLFSPFKHGVENVRDIRVVWKRRREVKSLLKGKMSVKTEHESVTFSNSQLSSLNTFASKVGAVADIYCSLSNDIDLLIDCLKTSSENDDAKVFESRVTFIVSLYDQLARSFSKYSHCLS